VSRSVTDLRASWCALYILYHCDDEKEGDKFSNPALSLITRTRLLTFLQYISARLDVYSLFEIFRGKSAIRLSYQSALTIDLWLQSEFVTTLRSLLIVNLNHLNNTSVLVFRSKSKRFTPIIYLRIMHK
jgi:hypothetical protein